MKQTATSRRAVRKRLLGPRPLEWPGLWAVPRAPSFDCQVAVDFVAPGRTCPDPVGQLLAESTMHILVTFAVEAEFAPWRRLRNLEEVKISEVTAFRGQIGRARVDFVLTGMGVENAFRVTETVLNEPYQFCVTAGFAGSLKEEHSVGNILVADAAQILGQ